MHYTIFIPNVSTPGEAMDRWAELGLDELCNVAGEESSRPSHAMAAGLAPGDHTSGCYFGWNGKGPEYDSLFQNGDGMRWHPCPPKGDRKKGDYFIGFPAERKPSPTDLIRHSDKGLQYPGLDVELCDGNQWAIPSAHSLPHQVGLNWETGEIERRAHPDFSRYSQQAGLYGRQMFDSKEAIATLAAMNEAVDDEEEASFELTLEGAFDHCVLALQINYRVNAEIVDLLGLLNDEAAILNVVCASFDLLMVEKAEESGEIPGPTIKLPVGAIAQAELAAEQMERYHSN